MTRSALMLPALAASLLLLAACGGGAVGTAANMVPGSVPFDRPEYSVSVLGVGQSPRASVTCIDLIGLMCEVSWTGNDRWDDAIVYRSTVDDPSTATEIGRVWAVWPFIADRNVVSGTRYYYWVAFEDKSGQQSRLSPSASACAAYFGQSCSEETPPPSPPTPPPPTTAGTGAARETADRALAMDLAFSANGPGFTHVGADPGARVSRAELLSYLQGEAGQHWNGILRFDEQPVVRVRSNVPESGLNQIEAVVGLLNIYLPVDWQLEFDRDAPAVARSIPEDGEILIDYSRNSSWGAGKWNNLGDATKYTLGSTIKKALIRVDDSKAEDLTYYVLAHEILHALGRHHPTDEGHATIMQPVTPKDLPAFLLHPLDAEALLAVYSRLEAGDAEINVDLGPWEEDGEALFGASGFATFGIEYRNGSARPWAYGMSPRSSLADNDRLEGNATWSGNLVGFTPAGRSVAGDAGLAVILEDLTGDLSFSDMLHDDATTWRTGRLDYAVQIGGNAFVRSDGDEGDIDGRFFGPGHESMGGTLQRDDLRAAFGGTRE